MTESTNLNRYLPEKIRLQIETQFYAQVNQQARLEEIVKDEDFWDAPEKHVGLFSDHGVVHVRDVVHQIIDVLGLINGVLIPARAPARLDFFMRGYGVMVAYLHDIGMRDFSSFGRAMHPEFASQYVFSPDFDPLLEVIWEENCGNIAWRLLNLAQQGLLTQPPQTVLREMLAMSNCHSKSKVPVGVLNDPARLRALMQNVISTDLNILYLQHRLRVAQASGTSREDILAAQAALLEASQTVNASAGVCADLERFYADYTQEAYSWLVSDHPAVQALRADVIDTLRTLRCADALRQRGTVLKTSGSYEIFIDQMSGNAIFALREGDNHLYMLELSNPLSSGEANLASSELDHEGNLRVGFHRGYFASAETIQRAAHYAAVVVNDIQSDVIESFIVPDPVPELKAADDIKILIEGTDGNLDFADQVTQELVRLDPELSTRVQPVSSLQSATPAERQQYLQAPHVDWDILDRVELLQHLASSGQKMDGLNVEEAFRHVKLIHVKAGDTLIQANTPASFVYIPFREGLRIIPLGGYKTFTVRAWMPLGNTGVIRGAMRNATVVSDRDMHLLMIPKDVYLKHWHHPHTTQELRQILLGHDVN